MKICHIIANLYAGGAQTFVVLLAVEQKQMGHDVSIILIDAFNSSTFENFLTNQLQKHQIPVYSLDRKPGKNFSVFKSLFKLNTYIKLLKPTILNSHLQFTHLIVSLYLKIFRQKNQLILTIHNAPEIWNFQTLQTNLKTPSIYCSGSSLATSITRDCKKLVISNGIKKPIILPLAQQIFENFKVNTSHKLILMVGKLSHQKNYPLAVEIAKHYQNKNVSFLICGIKEETANQDLALFETVKNIHYLGIKVPQEIYSLMYYCDCFLNTSHYEGLPITLLEAFFIGTPCILSDILPHHEIGDTMPACYLANGFDSDTFIEKIDVCLQLNQSKESVLQLRENQLQKYSIAETAKQYISFYEEVLG
ncbi:glycosyltransferase family 4 protein [Pedobacter alpinus]|uniref:Glycosyltransferase family 4 protein n=1 Tax=Pedobacter alpinus TaxID=1590643 RepID=A0ABW5TSE7_9SPHI